MQVSKDKVVTFHYRLSSDDGELIEDSFGGEPLVYLHGQGNLIVGMENALDGKMVGDTFEVNISAAEGYGERHEGLLQRVPRSAFENIDEIRVGMRFRATIEDGEVPVIITEVSTEEVAVDGNHPLAGQTLTFKVEVKDIRAASAEERAHGHIHDTGEQPH